MKIAVLGGTGPEGLGLAIRLALAGEHVLIGSRSSERAVAAAASVQQAVPAARVEGLTNEQAAREADAAVLSLPYDALRQALPPLAGLLAGKAVLSPINALAVVNGQLRALDVPEGSAAQLVQVLLPQTLVACAFNHIDNALLRRPDRVLRGDVLVCTDHTAAWELAAGLVRRMPELRPVHAGPLALARYVENFTAVLLSLNRLHRARTSLRIVGLREE